MNTNRTGSPSAFPAHHPTADGSAHARRADAPSNGAVNERCSGTRPAASGACDTAPAASREHSRERAASARRNRSLAASLAATAAVLIALSIIGTLMTRPAYFGIGVSDAGPETPVWYNEGVQPSYDQLAEALLSGNVMLPDKVPDWLLAMDNPYDTELRDAIANETGISYEWDHAYFNGQYCVYFGVVPCLLFFVPYHLVTGGAPLPTGIVVHTCLALFIAGTAALLYLACTRRFTRLSPAWACLALIGIVGSSVIGYVVAYPALYQIPAICSLALAAWGLFFWWRGCITDRMRWYCLGSVCIALILGTRPQLIILAAFGLFPLAHALKQRRGRARALTAALVPFVVVGAGMAWYNWARFGSPTDFGATYNLTVVDLTARHFETDRVPLGLYYYLFQLPNLIERFPFLTPCDLSWAYTLDSYTEPMPGGLFVLFPFLWGLIGAFFPSRRDDAPTTEGRMLGRWFVPSTAFPFVLFGFVLTVLDVEFGGVVARYQLDFAFLFAYAAGLGWLRIASAGPVGRAGLAVFGLLAGEVGACIAGFLLLV